MNLNPTRVLAVIGAALVLMIGGAVAYASIPAPDGTITACMTKASGTIRLIDAEAGAACRSTEKQVTWNQEGQPGEDFADLNTYVADDHTHERVSDLLWTSSDYCDPGDPVMGIDEMIVRPETYELYRQDGTGDFAGQEGYHVVVRGGASGYAIPFCLDVNGDRP